MKKYSGLVFATALAFGTAALAAQTGSGSQSYPSQQSNPNSQSPSYQTSPSTQSQEDMHTRRNSTESTTNNADMIFGKVESYQPGQSLTISTPDSAQGTRTFDLSKQDVKAKVSSDVKVGDWVSVAQKTDSSGKQTITVKKSKSAAREQGQQTQQR